MDAKTKAIVSHLFVIGWIIALIVNSSKKEEMASFYIRQNLGFIIVWLALTILRVLPVVGPVIWAVGGILLFVGWLMSLIWSIQGEQRAVPWLGDQFQTWFRGF
ncbi:MAG: hypothetical protein RB288_11160 [Bacteroidales bacterium]|jgi:uncharacterized membrane protein|nr:hypothetical protein [Bacteroidales bacterium]HOC48693.1 hypothetical protein [Bacteroidales bacterium]HPS98366.1 hypothetical protein [Bacteroidales bacterium]